MGPRFCKRGNLVADEAEREGEEASMGPRFCKRGNLAALAHDGALASGFNGATLL